MSLLAVFLLGTASAFAQLSPACREGAPVLARDLSGLAHVRAEVVTRELRNQVGKPFSAQAWTEERKALEDLDLFAQVSVTCRDTTLSIGSNELAPPSSGIALHYGFIELFQYFPTPTVKQSDQDGWMVGGAFAALNLLGWDIRAELQARGTLSPWLQAKEYAFYASAPWAATKARSSSRCRRRNSKLT